jgi:hypothetical protein
MSADVLGGLMSSVLAVGPNVPGSNPAKDDTFLRANKVSSTTSFGGQVKPSVMSQDFKTC